MASEPNEKKAEPKVTRKKISPYPIEGELVHEAVKVVLDIIRVSPKGLVAQIKSGMCVVGSHYQCQFTLPQSRAPIQVEGKVFKTFDRSLDPKDVKKIERMTEVLFLKLKDSDKSAIANFMKAVGQKD